MILISIGLLNCWNFFLSCWKASFTLVVKLCSCGLYYNRHIKSHANVVTLASDNNVLRKRKRISTEEFGLEIKTGVGESMQKLICSQLRAGEKKAQPKCQEVHSNCQGSTLEKGCSFLEFSWLPGFLLTSQDTLSSSCSFLLSHLTSKWKICWDLIHCLLTRYISQGDLIHAVEIPDSLV